MRHVLVADDDEDIRRLIGFTLRRRGYTVVEASSGDAALALVHLETPDLVVLDVMMPGLTGLQVARALRADPTTSTIPIVMLSAGGHVEDIDSGLASGAHSYVVKPFVPRELAAHIDTVLADGTAAQITNETD